MRTHRVCAALPPFLILLVVLCVPWRALAGPSVVPTAEGQIGEDQPILNDVVGTRVESIRGGQADIILGGIFVAPGVPSPVPSFEFLTDMIHGYPEPVPIDSTPVSFEQGNVEKQPPSSASSACLDGSYRAAFSVAEDGPMSGTMNVNTQVFDADGNTVATNTITVPNEFPFADPAMSKTGVSVDNAGRVTVAYTEFTGGLPRVRAQRLAANGTVLDADFLVNGLANDAGVALLDPAGNRLMVTMGAGIIKANVVDLSGGTPVVLPEFQVSTTPAAVANLNPAVASNPETGETTVVWENASGIVGDPVNVFARRFDADGNPIGNDFRVNTTTANAQGQPQVAYGKQNLSAIVWAGAGDQLPNDALDTFLQVYDPNGNPIGGEIKVNTGVDALQDRPSVRFLADSDSQGRPQVMVTWRDVGQEDGSQPNGTGSSYKCFSIEGFPDPTAIFADGFESGDTSSWSEQQP